MRKGGAEAHHQQPQGIELSLSGNLLQKHYNEVLASLLAEGVSEGTLQSRPLKNMF